MEVRERSQRRTPISKPQEKKPRAHCTANRISDGRFQDEGCSAVCVCVRARAPGDDEDPACFASGEKYVHLGNLCGQFSEADRN